MDIVELIKREHSKTSTLFDKLVDTSDSAVKTRERLFAQLKTGLEAHGKVVQDLVYPLLRKEETTRDLVPDLKDRNEVKRQLADLERTPKEDEGFLPKLKEFKKVVEQHLRTEERQIFPAIKKAIGGEEAEELAKRIAAETREELQEGKQDEEVTSGNGRSGEEVSSASRAEGSRRGTNFEQMVKSASRNAQRAGEETAETAEQAIGAASSGVREIADTATRHLDRTFQSVSGATGIYTETAQHASDGLRTLMTVPTVAASAMQEVQRAWADVFSKGLQRNARVTKELLSCTNPRDLAAVHRRFIDDTIDSWMESNRRVLQATRQATDAALRPIEEHVERSQQEERGHRGRRNKAA
jgi:hemerythrin superfamily protein